MKNLLFYSRNLLLTKNVKYILSVLWDYIVVYNPNDTIFSVDLFLIYKNEKVFIKNFKFTSLKWFKFYKNFNTTIHSKCRDIKWKDKDLTILLKIKSPSNYKYVIPSNYKKGKLM
jgi:hypothetical protein